MSNLKTKRVQIGDHSTATNNFVMHQSDTPDGKVHISNGTLDDHTSKMTLTHDGKLGVGTDSPTSGLHVQTDTNPVMKVSRGTNNAANINLYYNTTFTGQVSGSAGAFQLSSVGSSTPMQFYTDGSKNMEIDENGYVTTPNQPCFSVTHNTVSSVDARSGYVAFRSINTTYINQGNHFTSSDGRFTAPVAGNYLFGCTLRYDSFTDQYFYVTIKKNDAYGARDLKSSNGNYLHASVHVILPMAVNDYVHVGLNSNADSSIDINSDTHFYGYLLG
jgi:hypothetical protein